MSNSAQAIEQAKEILKSEGPMKFDDLVEKTRNRVSSVIRSDSLLLAMYRDPHFSIEHGLIVFNSSGKIQLFEYDVYIHKRN